MYTTDMYEGMVAETVSLDGHGGDTVYAYLARPIGAGPFPGVVLIHHLPGWDEWLSRGDAPVRPPRLRRDQPQPVPPRGPRRPG